MAIQDNTRIETHPAGTSNLGGVINGNWQQLELIFDPDPTVPHLYDGTAADVGNLVRDNIFRDGEDVLTTTTPTIDWAGEPYKSHLLTGATTYAFSNLAKGAFLVLHITCDGTGRALTWPASVTFVGADAGAAIAASKEAWVKFHCTDSGTPVVIGEYLEEL